jgi:hypothetical protein
MNISMMSFPVHAVRPRSVLIETITCTGILSDYFLMTQCKKLFAVWLLVTLFPVLWFGDPCRCFSDVFGASERHRLSRGNSFSPYTVATSIYWSSATQTWAILPVHFSSFVVPGQSSLCRSPSTVVVLNFHFCFLMSAYICTIACFQRFRECGRKYVVFLSSWCLPNPHVSLYSLFSVANPVTPIS